MNAAGEERQEAGGRRQEGFSQIKSDCHSSSYTGKPEFDEAENLPLFEYDLVSEFPIIA